VILVDTGALCAPADRNDTHHRAARAFYQTILALCEQHRIALELVP